MIKLTINPDTKAEQHTFNQPSIVIGTGASEQITLPLSEESLQEEHVKILYQDEGYLIINTANDPLVTLNDEPFGKRVLATGDRLTLASTTIQFNAVEQQEATSAELTEQNDELDDLLMGEAESTLDEPMLIPEAENFLKDLSTENIDIEEELLKLNELFQDDDETPKAEPASAPTTQEEEINFEELDVDALFEKVEQLDLEIKEQSPGEETPAVKFPVDQEIPEEKLYRDEESTEGDTAIEFTEAAADDELLFLDEEEELPSEEALSLEENDKEEEEEVFFTEEEEEEPLTTDSFLEEEAIEEEVDEEEFTFFDEDPNATATKEQQSPVQGFFSKTIKSTRFLTAAMVLFAMTGILGAVTYFNLTSSNATEKIYAAQGTADFAMAMAHASLHQETSEKGNLETNLQNVLSSQDRADSIIDNKGTLQSPYYNLHLITTDEGKDFFVVAQPTSGLKQWLLPRPAVFLSSKSMILQQTKNIATLRSLIHQKYPQEVTGEIISQLCEEGTPITLSTLEGSPSGQGFTPPQELQEIAPTATQLVYNAPRYYKFSQRFLQYATQQENPKQLKNYPYFVLYASDGVEAATQAKIRNLGIPFFFGSLQFSEEGNIASGHLLKEEEIPEPIATATEEIFEQEDSVEEETATLATTTPEPTVEETETFQTEPLFTAIDEAEGLIELTTAVTELATHLNSEQVPNLDRLLTLQNNFRSRVLKKIGEIVLSPQQQAGETNSFTVENRELLDHILNTAKVNDREEKEFYLQEFDLLVEQYRKSFQRQQQQLSEAESTPAKKNEIETQISSVPLNKIAAPQEGEEKRDFGRLGQQILIRESAQQPSPERNANLQEAINLLTQATDDNRAYWQDILEARRLLAEHPKAKIMEIISSTLGVSQAQQPLPQKIRNTMKKYISAIQAVATTDETQQYYIQYEHLKRTQKNNLQHVIDDAQIIQEQNTALGSAMNEYISYLEEFHNDYEIAKQQGFIATNRRYHSTMLTRLARQIKASKNLKNKLTKVSTKINDASHAYESLASVELMRINAEEPISAKNTLALERESNKISYPIVLSNNIAHKIIKVLDTDVSPIP